MITYFANTFSVNGIEHSIPPWDRNYYILMVQGTPQSAVTIFLDDLMGDLQIHDIPVQAFMSCVFPDTPDALIIPSLKQVILNGNNLPGLLKAIVEHSTDFNFPLVKLDLGKFCNNDLLQHYHKDIQSLEEKLIFQQQLAFQTLRQANLEAAPLGPVSNEMLFLLQSLFPVTAENTGRPAKVLASSLTSSGWLSNLQDITISLKRRYVLHGSPSFIRTFFQLAESRAYNLNMKCHLIINPLIPEQIEGIIFPEEKQAVIVHSKRHPLVPGIDDITLNFDSSDPSPMEEVNLEKNFKSVLSYLVKAHSYREEMDEYYWYTVDLEQLFIQRRRIMHQLMTLCDGQELWQYFVKK